MKTYRQSLDELHFTREEKNAMADRLTAGESRGGGKVRSIRRTVAVGVAAALLMTMGVGAAVTLTPAGEVFASVFGGAPAQTEISPLSLAGPPPRRRSWTGWGYPSGPATRRTV